RGRRARLLHSSGHGRLDAFGQIFNAAAVEFIGQPENRRAPDAPVSYPVLWSAAHLDVVQWNGSAPNAGPGPLFQNITTALAVYGQIDMHADAGFRGYSSSVDFDGLAEIQNWVYALKSPQWPESILGAVSQEKAGRGEALYQAQCASCHELSSRDDPKRKLQATLTPVDAVGTDPRMAQNFLDSRSNSGFLTGKKTAYVAGDVMETQTPTINLVVHAAMGAALHHPVQTVKAALTDYHSVHKAAIDAHPDYYKARPLDGIWSSAPYLHNGSVPTLHDLLLPESERPRQFHVGSREMDTKYVGLNTAAGAGSSLFDTSLPGNGNGGHAYGTALSEPERMDLLEYLKTL
ncbi:MAG: cytochrome c, partial [Pseudomonadota bacterium]